MERIVEDMHRTKEYVEKIRYGQEKVHSTHSACKTGGRDFVSAEQFKRVKERINFAFDQYAKLFSECMRRDHVLAESLIQTQMGRSKKIICTDQCHTTLAAFVKQVKEEFEMPELYIPIQDYESTGNLSQAASSHKKKRRARSATTTKKKKKRSASSKSVKSANAASRKSEAVNDVDEIE